MQSHRHIHEPPVLSKTPPPPLKPPPPKRHPSFSTEWPHEKRQFLMHRPRLQRAPSRSRAPPSPLISREQQQRPSVMMAKHVSQPLLSRE